MLAVVGCAVNYQSGKWGMYTLDKEAYNPCLSLFAISAELCVVFIFAHGAKCIGA
jgi:hypothetical protein